MAGVDPYLRTSFEFLIEQRFPEGVSSEEALADLRLPMLIKATESWLRSGSIFEVPDLFPITRIGNIIAALGSPRSFSALASDPGVLVMEASRSGIGPECGQSVPFTRASAVHAPPIGEFGDCAVVGIIDNGIDISHDAFRDSNGASRIRAYWDQTASNSVGTDLIPFGLVYENASLNRMLLSRTPTHHSILPQDCKHGTHVASIAAGRSAGSFQGGMAPDAELVVVRLKEPSPTGDSIEQMTALRFVTHTAELTGKPVVINMSFGVAGGARDGTSLLEQAIENITEGGSKPGVVIVTSAGNQREAQRHCRAIVLPEESKSIEWETSGGSRQLQDVVEFWFESRPDMLVELSYNGERVAGPVRAGNPLHPINTEDGNRVRITYLPWHHANGLSYFTVAVGPQGREEIQPARLSARFINTSSFECQVDGWADQTSTNEIRFLTYVNQSITLTSPATSYSVITVAASSTDNPSSSNHDSSIGPTFDLREKPELAAPGASIEAAQAGTKTGAVEMSGTSQAAAHVSGAVALLLSMYFKIDRANPEANLKSLSAKQVQAALKCTTQQPSGSWSSVLGHGVLDAESLLRRLVG